MEWIKVERESLDEAARVAVRVLGEGGVIVFPAERLYGIGVDALNPDAVRRVFALKGRGGAAPLSVIVGDMAGADEWVEVSKSARALMRDFWPGPLTLVLPLKKDLPDEVVAGSGRLGIRVPGSDLARLIALGSENPVTATSANPSGEKSGKSAEQALAGLDGQVDLVLDAGKLPGPPGSTVARTEEGRVDILRKGIISRERLESSLKGMRPE